MSYKKHIIVVGTARSGTSWLSETIAQQHRYRMLFEPEHETQTPRGYLLCDQWLTSSSMGNDAKKYLKQLFANRVDCDWIAQNSNRSLKRHLWPFLPKKYVIKFVRGSLMAKCLNEYFDIPLIHIVRNPYNVIQSQQQVIFPWLYDLSRFSNQENLVELIKQQFDFDITTFKNFDSLERLAIRWCIENALPLEYLEPYKGKAEIVKYETLLNDINLFYKLCKDFNLEPISHLEKVYKRPSTKTHPKINTLGNSAAVNFWNDDGLKKVNRILDIFGTTMYPKISEAKFL